MVFVFIQREPGIGSPPDAVGTIVTLTGTPDRPIPSATIICHGLLAPAEDMDPYALRDWLMEVSGDHPERVVPAGTGGPNSLTRILEYLAPNTHTKDDDEQGTAG